MKLQSVFRVVHRRQVAIGLASILTFLACAELPAAVIYRETFGNVSSPLARQNPNIFGWQVFNQSGAPLTMVNGNHGVDTNLGYPADLANVNAGPNSDGSTGAVGPGLLFWASGQAGRLSFTPEFTLNIADYEPGSIAFSWYQGNANTTDPFRLAVQIDGVWYVSTDAKTNTVSGITGSSFGSLAGPNAELMTVPFNSAADQWQVLNFNGTYDGGVNTATSSSLGGMFLSANATVLSGTITAFGYMYWNPATALGSPSANAGGNVRIDNFQIDASPIPEPGTVALLAFAGVGLMVFRRRAR